MVPSPEPLRTSALSAAGSSTAYASLLIQWPSSSLILSHLLQISCLLTTVLGPTNPFSCSTFHCPEKQSLSSQPLKLLQMPSVMLWCSLWTCEPAPSRDLSSTLTTSPHCPLHQTDCTKSACSHHTYVSAISSSLAPPPQSSAGTTVLALHSCPRQETSHSSHPSHTFLLHCIQLLTVIPLHQRDLFSQV